MKHYSSYYKRLHVRRIKIAVLAVIVSMFFLPVFVKFERSGDNMFTVLLDGVSVGTVASPEEAEGYAREARRQIASDSSELVLVESNIELQGQEVLFGRTDDPDEIGKKFADYPTILETAQELKDAGYRIFSSDAEMNVFSGDSAWVLDDTLNVDQARLDYMDLCVELYQNDLTAYANQWSTPWYQAMAGEVPILTADIQSYADDSVNVWDADQFAEATASLDKTEVFAFGLPAWGVLTMRDNVGDTSGKWGVCSGPAYGFDGGTYIGISSQSKRKETAWEFVKFCTLNEDTADWWIDYSQGDTVSLKSALEKHKDDENAIYGGEKLYQFWLKQAEGIDTSKVTRYDQAIGDAFGNAISSVKTGEKTKEDALNDFYDVIESTYPEIKVVR